MKHVTLLQNRDPDLYTRACCVDPLACGWLNQLFCWPQIVTLGRWARCANWGIKVGGKNWMEKMANLKLNEHLARSNVPISIRFETSWCWDIWAKAAFVLHQPECLAQRLTSIEAILILLIGLPIVAKAIVGHSSLAQPIGWFFSCPIPWNSTHVISKWWPWNDKLGDLTKS